MSNKNFIFNYNTFADKGVGRNFTTRSDLGAGLNLNKRTYPCRIPDDTAIKINQVDIMDPHLLA